MGVVQPPQPIPGVDQIARALGAMIGLEYEMAQPESEDLRGELDRVRVLLALECLGGPLPPDASDYGERLGRVRDLLRDLVPRFYDLPQAEVAKILCLRLGNVDDQEGAQLAESITTVFQLNRAQPDPSLNRTELYSKANEIWNRPAHPDNRFFYRHRLRPVLPTLAEWILTSEREHRISTGGPAPPDPAPPRVGDTPTALAAALPDPRDRRVVAERRRQTRVSRTRTVAVAAVASLTAAIAITATLVLGRDASDGKPDPGFLLLDPPTVPIEVKARAGGSPFADDVVVAPGSTVQIVTAIRNIGRLTSTNVSMRLGLSELLSLTPGSCRVRSTRNSDLAPCDDNFANGGFQYRSFGGGAWTQVYVDAKVAKRAVLGAELLAQGVVNSDETPELRDGARLHVRATSSLNTGKRR